VCDKYKKKLSLLRFGSSNLWLEQEVDSWDETDSDNEENTSSRETAV
jgi:hypothetical protein